METKKWFEKKTILVLGLAKSGFAAAKLLHQNGANVVVNDKQPFEENYAAQKLQEAGFEVICGDHPISLFDTNSFDLLIKNPGIPYENVMVQEALKRNIPIWTEIELAYLLTEARFIGITGSNGKTTTTTLIYEMLKADHKQAKIAGNIGTVACEVAAHAEKDDWIVTELSSFQLMGTKTFRANIGIILNVVDAHLDYHHTRQSYEQAKQAVYKNQLKDDTAIINADDETVCRLAEASSGKKVYFSLTQQIENGACIKNETIYFNQNPIIERKDVVLPGAHNLENILAAICAVKQAGVSNEAIREVLTTFSGVKHRLQYVAEFNGRKFYNDSKATNLLATSKALDAFKQPVILLAGGLDRGNELDGLKEHMGYVKTIVTFGQTAGKFQKLGRELGIHQIKRVDNVEQAVLEAYKLSEANDIILLSPACASWDQFKSFEDRGDMFISAVHMLK